MLGVLPPEIILSILCYLPIQQLQRLCRVSKPWRCFMKTNKENIFHAAAILHGFIPSRTKTIDSAPVPKKWSEDIHTWSELCHKFYKTHLRWEGQESSYSSHVGTAGKAVWRFKIDEEQETVITTHFDGGLRVAPIESSGSDILWLLPHSEVNGYAHVEFTDGFVIFTRRGETVDVWRRKRDVKHVTSRPSTLYNDFVQLRARRIAWQSEESAIQDDRGAFVPWTVISPPNPTRALRAVHSKLLLASQVAGEAYLYDLSTGQLIQSIQFRTREDPVVDVNYVDFSQRHAFICTHSDVLIFPLDPSDTSTLLRFPTNVAGISEVFAKTTYCLKYSDSGNPIYAVNTENEISLLTPCVVAKETPSELGIWHCNAVHVSPCGSHFVAADAAGNICIVRDFERALRTGTPLRDNIIIVNVGYPIRYLAYDDDHRIAVYVDDHGVFVLPHIMNVTVPIRTYTMEPVDSEDMVVLHVQQNLYSGLVQLCSCLQLTRSELWYTWTRMHTRPELGIANNVLRRIDFSQPSEPPPQQQSPYSVLMMELG